MKILCLFNNKCALELFDWLKSEGHETILCTERLVPLWCREQKFDLSVSYTYRYILTEEIIHALNNNVVNIHTALLPFNRGADPNMWSIIDGTPRGVTLHYINPGLDKGDLIMQRLVLDTDAETLASSYNNLDMAAKTLFKEAFTCYKYWPEMKKKALGQGSYHSVKDGDKFKNIIKTYNIGIIKFRKYLSEWGLKEK